MAYILLKVISYTVYSSSRFLLTTWVQTNAVHKTLLSWKQLYIDSDNNDTKIQYTSKYTSYLLLII